jgi:hypothetical protein
MFARIVVALYAFLLMTMPGEAGTRLSAAEISALAPGEYVGTWKGKKKLHLTLNPNGTVRGTVNGIGYRGKWYVSGQSLCVVFRIMGTEKTKCGGIHRQGAWLVGYYKQGTPRLRLRAG